MTARRFLPPWSIEDQDACFVVRDRGGQQLAYVYFDLYSRQNRSQAATAATKDFIRAVTTELYSLNRAANPGRRGKAAWLILGDHKSKLPRSRTP
jgi:hypothetical protein